MFSSSATYPPQALLTATIDRILNPVRIHYKKRGRSTTKPGPLLRKQIPIKTNQWDESRPGFLEADTVAHCGESLCGIFAYTLHCVDIATGWTEQRAVWGKGEQGVLEQIKKTSKLCCPSPYSASIATTDQSFSITTSGNTSPKENIRYGSPVAEPITKTIMPM